MGIVHAGLSPVIEIAGVRPNLMLVAVVLVTRWPASGLSDLGLRGRPDREPAQPRATWAVPLSLLLVSAMVPAAIGFSAG